MNAEASDPKTTITSAPLTHIFSVSNSSVLGVEVLGPDPGGFFG